MENCIFCKIANGEIPSATLYEDGEFRVILDLGPASKGGDGREGDDPREAYGKEADRRASLRRIQYRTE